MDSVGCISIYVFKEVVVNSREGFKDIGVGGRGGNDVTIVIVYQIINKYFKELRSFSTALTVSFNVHTRLLPGDSMSRVVTETSWHGIGVPFIVAEYGTRRLRASSSQSLRGPV